MFEPREEDGVLVLEYQSSNLCLSVILEAEILKILDEWHPVALVLDFSDLTEGLSPAFVDEVLPMIDSMMDKDLVVVLPAPFLSSLDSRKEVQRFASVRVALAILRASVM